MDSSKLKYRRPLPDSPNPKLSPTKNLNNTAVKSAPDSLKRKLAPAHKNPVTPNRASLFLEKAYSKDAKKGGDDVSIMSSLQRSTINSSVKKKPKKASASTPPPSDYHLRTFSSAVADAKEEPRDPRLKNMPPAILPAREVDSSSEYKVVADSPARIKKHLSTDYGNSERQQQQQQQGGRRHMSSADGGGDAGLVRFVKPLSAVEGRRGLA